MSVLEEIHVLLINVILVFLSQGFRYHKLLKSFTQLLVNHRYTDFVKSLYDCITMSKTYYKQDDTHYFFSVMFLIEPVNLNTIRVNLSILEINLLKYHQFNFGIRFLNINDSL